jgi:hypothetical protein
MKRVINYNPFSYMPELNSAVLRELKQNNTVFPDIKRIIYNIGKKSYRKLDENGKSVRDADGKLVMSEPIDVLATVVYFVDETKITVINSVADGVKFEDHTLSNGSTVKVASRESKEMGLVYAIVKRLLTKYDKDGKPLDSATGRILNDYVKKSYDCVVENAELKIARAKSKAEHEAKLNTAKPKKKRYSIAETLARVNEMLDKADGPKAEGILNKLYSIFKN